jgi:hypothetical protein
VAIVQAGKQFTAADLKTSAGHVATMITQFVEDGIGLKSQLESWPDGDLLDLGLSQEEINALKGFYVGDLPAIANLLTASVWIKQLLGTGV